MKLLFTFLLAVLISNSAFAQMKDENFLVTMPDGFKVGFQNKTPTSRITELVPRNETVQDWSQMVTVQIYTGVPNLTPPKLYESMVALWAQACSGYNGINIAEGVENGYQTMTWLFVCPLLDTTGKPEATFFKVIQGKDAFYVAQRAYRYKPSNEETQAALLYMQSIKACDSRVPARPC